MELMAQIDAGGDGKIDLEELVEFANAAERRQQERNTQRGGRKAITMIKIGRVKAGGLFESGHIESSARAVWRGRASQGIIGNSAAQRSGRGIRDLAGTGRRVD